MKKALILAVASSCGLLALSTVQAQPTTVYDDNFANDSTLSSSYVNLNNINSAVQWAFTANSQLQLTAGASGKLDDLVGQFTPQTLSSVGSYVTFTASFNSPSLTTSGSAGSILFALDNAGGNVLSPAPGPYNPTGTTGPTATDITGGYMGMLGLNSTPKTSSKLYAKTAGGTNGLSYYQQAGPDTQLASGAASVNLNTGDNFQAIFTVKNLGGGQDQITGELYDATTSTAMDTYTTTTSIVPTSTFDTFDIGVYTGSESTGYNINLTDLNVIANVPEPTTFALAGLGLGALGLVRRIRRH
jgi:hypothetical protein